MHLGEKVKVVRESKEYSQEYMGKRLGISQQEYSRLEAGKIDISHERFVLIAEILKKTPKEI
jgi:transcriptional regulator with XRE-family HTH domain